MADVLFGDHFVWDSAKAASNARPEPAGHGVTFEEATSVFADPWALERPDVAHPDRLNNIIGMSVRSRLLFVVYAERGQDDQVRIISARRAAASERNSYERR